MNSICFFISCLNSIFWAIQRMASEFSTGILVMQSTDTNDKEISMKATFTKKLQVKFIFECNDGLLIKETIQKAIATNEGQTIILTSEGINEDGISVSKFEYKWSLKVK